MLDRQRQQTNLNSNLKIQKIQQKKYWMRLACRHATLAKHKTILATCDVPCRRSSARPRRTWGNEYKQATNTATNAHTHTVHQRRLMRSTERGSRSWIKQPTRYFHERLSVWKKMRRLLYWRRCAVCSSRDASDRPWEVCRMHFLLSLTLRFSYDIASATNTVFFSPKLLPHDFFALFFIPSALCAFLCGEVITRVVNGIRTECFFFFVFELFCRARITTRNAAREKIANGWCLHEKCEIEKW